MHKRIHVVHLWAVCMVFFSLVHGILYSMHVPALIYLIDKIIFSQCQLRIRAAHFKCFQIPIFLPFHFILCNTDVKSILSFCRIWEWFFLAGAVFCTNYCAAGLTFWDLHIWCFVPYIPPWRVPEETVTVFYTASVISPSSLQLLSFLSWPQSVVNDIIRVSRASLCSQYDFFSICTMICRTSIILFGFILGASIFSAIHAPVSLEQEHHNWIVDTHI